MDIVLNGDTLAVPEAHSVAALLDDQGLGDRRVAVEVNGAIVPRGRHATCQLAAGDRIEIVHALGGG
ncbi:MAG TPA: sulfur carrier protein ThiS [Luteimonas sp.]|nr:sulfur carrier protein ThiS [Luteimonas sp.]